MKLGGGRKMKVDFRQASAQGVMESEDWQKGKPTRQAAPSGAATTEMDQEWPEQVRTHTHGSRYSDQM